MAPVVAQESAIVPAAWVEIALAIAAFQPAPGAETGVPLEAVAAASTAAVPGLVAAEDHPALVEGVAGVAAAAVEAVGGGNRPLQGENT